MISTVLVLIKWWTVDETKQNLDKNLHCFLWVVVGDA